MQQLDQNPQRALLSDGPEDARWTLVLAHGSGTGMESPFLQLAARQLGREGIRVQRFEFPYMHKARIDGRRRPPDREPVLLETWREVVGQVAGQTPRLAFGGRSMGGRMASMLADALPAVDALVCFGYPFHPPGKPERLRTDHLETLETPALICQGERDTFGNAAEVATYTLAGSIRLHWLPDGDHELKPRKRSGYTAEDNWLSAIDATSGFLASL
ncbi:MAG: alpha/beta family hydrolase [Pseudomonadota bacterium]